MNTEPESKIQYSPIFPYKFKITDAFNQGIISLCQVLEHWIIKII